jgi:hypothetical protein
MCECVRAHGEIGEVLAEIVVKLLRQVLAGLAEEPGPGRFL